MISSSNLDQITSSSTADYIATLALPTIPLDVIARHAHRVEGAMLDHPEHADALDAVRLALHDHITARRGAPARVPATR